MDDRGERPAALNASTFDALGQSKHSFRSRQGRAGFPHGAGYAECRTWLGRSPTSSGKCPEMGSRDQRIDGDAARGFRRGGPPAYDRHSVSGPMVAVVARVSGYFANTA